VAKNMQIFIVALQNESDHLWEEVASVCIPSSLQSNGSKSV
jgi:hypothetical protein